MLYINYAVSSARWGFLILPIVTVVHENNGQYHLCLAAGIALAVPDLDDLISLVGAVASSALALIFPSILSILVFWRIRRGVFCLPWPVRVVRDVLVALLGVVGTIFGTYAAMRSTVKYFHDHHTSEKACNITYW